MASASPTYSAILVSYNTADLIGDAIDSLLGQTAPPTRIVVADNASTDESMSQLAARYGDRNDVVTFATGGNLGFARAVNLAAARTTGDLLLCNPDARLAPDACARLLAAKADHPDAALYGGTVLFPDGRLNPTTARPLATVWSLTCHGLLLSHLFPGHRLFDPERIPEWDRTTSRDVGMLSGVCVLIDRDRWEQLGGFDERFWLYGEDTDLSHRSGALGASPRFVAEAIVTHAPGSSSSDSARKIAWMRRGEVTYLRKHWQGLRLVHGLAMLWVGSALRAAAHRLRPRSGDTDWGAVFAARREWLAGFGPGPHDGPPEG